MKKLHILTCISNPVRYQSRYQLYREFEKRIANEPDAELWTAEMAFSSRPFEITEHDNPRHLQLRSGHELWHKENMLNLLLQRLPNDGNPVAFIDADVDFMRHDWVRETLQQLEHHDVVQMFGETIDLDSNSCIVTPERRRSTVAEYLDQRYQLNGDAEEGYSNRSSHCGYAWAWRRSALSEVGGLIDFSILGSADWQMACGLLGDIRKSVTYPVSEGYSRRLDEWGERAKRLRKNVGYVEGLLVHYWHGPKSARGYNWRTQILTDSGFDPERDLHRDWQGLYQLNDDGSERAIKLRDDLRKYFRSRDEDAS